MRPDRRPGAAPVANAARAAIESHGWEFAAATVDPVRGHTVVVAGLRINDTHFSRVLVIAIPRECQAVRDFVHHKMESYV